VLIPIHYALAPLPVLLQTSGTCEQLLELAREVDDVEVVPLEPGRKWSYGRKALGKTQDNALDQKCRDPVDPPVRRSSLQ
jgi:hypothetical protein